MILLTILLFIVIILITFLIVGASVGGSLFVIIFGDVIVAVGLIGLLIYWLIKRRHR